MNIINEMLVHAAAGAALVLLLYGIRKKCLRLAKKTG